MDTAVGSVRLPNPVMTASGTVGHGAELARYLDYAELGAVVVKSLAPYEWAGNPAPRVHPVPAGMINSVGLQGPGLSRWLAEELPVLAAAGARVVVSIWDAAWTTTLPRPTCWPRPTIRRWRQWWLWRSTCPVPTWRIGAACSPTRRTRRGPRWPPPPRAGLPRWAKLSATGDLVDIAAAAAEGGAEALTLINTLLGMVIDTDTRKPVLGGGGGGVSGRAIGPVAVRAVYDVHAALPEVPIVGVGGIASGTDAVEMLMAGARPCRWARQHSPTPGHPPKRCGNSPAGALTTV